MKRITIHMLVIILTIILNINQTTIARTIENKSKLYNKNILFLGDSLTSDTGIVKYNNHIQNITEANCVSYGVGGSTVAKIETDELYDISFTKRYKDIIKDYPDSEYWDFIIIFGGVNDFSQNVPIGDMNSDNTTFYGALNEIVYQLQSHYPKARIILMTPLIATYDGCAFDYNTNGQGVVLEEYRKVIREVARLQSCIVYETSYMSNLNPNNNSIMKRYYDAQVKDGIHPNEQGHKRIAIPLKNLLESLAE